MCVPGPSVLKGNHDLVCQSGVGAERMTAEAAAGARGVATGRLCAEGGRRGAGASEIQDSREGCRAAHGRLLPERCKTINRMGRLNEMSNVET